jgi:hypothetical protein
VEPFPRRADEGPRRASRSHDRSVFGDETDATAASAAHTILRSHVGSGRQLEGEHGTVYGTWIVRAMNDVVVVSHYAKLPDFAVTPANAKERARVLVEMFAAARRAEDVTALEFFSVVRSNVGS